MTRYLILFFLLVYSITFISAQSTQELSINSHKILFKNTDGKESKLEIDPGFRYAEFIFEDQTYGFFYHRNHQNIGKIRIIDSITKGEVARGRGSWVMGNAHLKFADRGKNGSHEKQGCKRI